ncbi:MAG: type II toxin-antitoxin system RelE/ParE family toxin [Methanoregula sp.]|nr:type II toxin-antitoxin system RelE/ParE family toxin [Methanoregula sp.]
MVLEISIGPKADRFLQGTDQQNFDRLSRKIRELASKPHPRGAKKIVGEEGVLRIRVGVHRILYSIENNNQILLIVNIDKRSRVYKR